MGVGKFLLSQVTGVIQQDQLMIGKHILMHGSITLGKK